MYAKLLSFIDTTNHYRVDRLFGLLPTDGRSPFSCFRTKHLTSIVQDFFEAKAILLGRLGRHNHALELYVYRLQDYTKAEE